MLDWRQGLLSVLLTMYQFVLSYIILVDLLVRYTRQSSDLSFHFNRAEDIHTRDQKPRMVFEEPSGRSCGG